MNIHIRYHTLKLMIASARLILILSLFISSCTRTNTKKWTIPLHSSTAQLQIALPRQISNVKQSVHLSDCTPCGKYHTVLADSAFIDVVEDTTGFFIPWLSDTTPKHLFYIEEELYPEYSHINESPDYDKELKAFIEMITRWDSRTKILRQHTSNRHAIVYYEEEDENGNVGSKKIDCITFIDGRFIKLHYIQSADFQMDFLDEVWTGLRKMTIVTETKK